MLAAPGEPDVEQAVGASSLSEVERMFKEAYEAEAERANLLKTQLEAALTEKLQAEGNDTGLKITVEAIGPMSPDELGGKSTWREAYEAAKAKAATLDEQLKKARGMASAAVGSPPPPPPPQAQYDGFEPPAALGDQAAQSSRSSSSSGNFKANPFSFMDGDKRDPSTFAKLEELAQKTIDDEAALRLIAVPVLGRRGPEQLTTRLPPSSKVRELMGGGQFSIVDAVEFERVYVFKGTVANGLAPADALEALRRRFADNGLAETSELFLQTCKDEGRFVVFVMLKEDLPKNEFAWWQWLLCGLCLLATLLSVNITSFSVATISQSQLNTLDMETVVKIAGKTIPTAVSILATVGSQELARRAAAAKYGVELTPPFFIPVWPFPSVGCLGAVTRRLTTVPNKEAAAGMSVAAGVAGYLVSLVILLYGLSLGPDPDKIVNLNFQMLPLVLKLVLKPFLGQSSVTDQSDPFVDPVSLAFPANAVTIGGIIGLIVTSLNLLPLGRLDGGILAKGVLGSRSSGLLGLLGTFLLLIGTFAPDEAGLLFINFGFYAIIFQSGTENPPRDGVTELDGSLKALSMFLVVVGILLSIPGSLLPGI